MMFTKRIVSIAVAVATTISLCSGQMFWTAKPLTVEAHTELDHIAYCPIQTFTEYAIAVIYIGGTVIHDYINGVPVVLIEGRASEYYPELTNIDIPDTMRKICDDFSETSLVKSQTGVKYADNWVVDCDTDVTTAVTTTMVTTYTTTTQTAVSTTVTTKNPDEGITYILIGDANLDGIVNVRDAAFIAATLARGKGDTLPVNADFNCDKQINVRDAAALANYLAIKK